MRTINTKVMIDVLDAGIIANPAGSTPIEYRDAIDPVVIFGIDNTEAAVRLGWIVFSRQDGRVIYSRTASGALALSAMRDGADLVTALATKRHIGPRMLSALWTIALTHGASKVSVARLIGPHGSRAYGWRSVQRLIARGLVEDRGDANRARLYLTAQGWLMLALHRTR